MNIKKCIYCENEKTLDNFGYSNEGNLNREKLIYTNRKYKKNKYLKNAQSKSRVV